MTLSQYGKIVQEKINTTQDLMALQEEKDRIHRADKTVMDEAIFDDEVPNKAQPHEYTGIVKSVDPWNKN